MRSFLSILALCCTLAIGCRSVTPQINDLAPVKDPIEGLVFLSFVMHNDSLSGKSIQLTSKTIVHQKLKSDPRNSEDLNRVWISQLSADGKKLSTVAIDHPLYRRVEFANDQGQFQSKEIILQDAEFFARVTLFSQAEYIQVEEELAGKIIFTTKHNLRD